MKKTSIIIPCYNGGRYLCEAVESAQKQTYQHKEIIIVNDGSTDIVTLNIFQDLKQSGVICVMHQKNRGLAATRNTGIACATGEYICCLDDDDIIGETYIEECVKILEKNSDIGFVYSNVQLFGDYKKVWKTGPFDPYRLAYQNTIPVSAVFRKVCWDMAGGFNANMKYGYEDWDFWIGVVEGGWTGAWIQKILFYHRKHGKTMTNRAAMKHAFLYTKITFNHPYFFSKKSMQVLREKSSLSLFGLAQCRMILFSRCIISKIFGLCKKKIFLRLQILVRNGILKIQERTIFNSIDSCIFWNVAKNENNVGCENAIRCENDNGNKIDKMNEVFQRFSTWSPFISVVVPLYGHTQYLRECFDSILRQDYDLFELILVNDDPDNATMRGIVDEYKEKNNIIIIQNIVHSGISYSLNKGIVQSRGEYITCVDCDDFLQRNALSRVARCIQELPEKFYISTQIIDIDEDGMIISPRPRPQQPKDLLRGMYAGHLKAVRRDVFESVGLFNSKFDGCQDYDLALRVQQKYPLYFLQEYLYYYRWHTQGYSMSHKKLQKEMARNIKTYHEKALVSHNSV
jgi:glycosyltransferase involved in cell wall biosynthesis